MNDSVPSADDRGLASGSDSAGDWTCPFCALHCDDLRAAAGGATPTVVTDCPRAQAGLAAAFAAREATPLRGGQPCSLEAALDAAAQVLIEARQPLLAGLAAEVHGQRALLRLAAQCHAIVDHAHGAALAAVLTATQDRGVFTTTLGEVRTRADLVVFVGTPPVAAFPRLAERLGLGGLDKQVRLLGGEAWPGVPQARAVPLHGDLFDTLAWLNARLIGRPLPPAVGATVELAALADALRGARYAAIVFAPGALPGTQPALLIESLHRLVKTLNRSTRAGALMLAGPDAALTAQQVMTWRAGVPLRSGFHPQGLAHEPHRYGVARLLEQRAVDALLWVSCFDATLWPPAWPADATAAPLRSVVLGHPAMADDARARQAEVFIPVAVPGVHTGGHLTRTDVVVTVPLQALAPSDLPDVASVAEALLASVTRLRPATPSAAPADTAGATP